MAVTWTARTIGFLASIVRAVASVIGGLIIVHAVFVLFGANTHNVLVEFTAGIRDSFGWFTKNLFQPSDKNMGEAINDALAGFIWVFLGSLAAKFIARLAPAGSSSKDKDKSSKKKDDTPRSTPVQKKQEKPADEPKQEAPAKEEPKQEAPKQEARKQEDESPKDEASKDEAPKDDLPRYDAPKDDAPQDAPKERSEPEPEEESSAKHQAKETARDDERAEDRDKAQA